MKQQIKLSMEQGDSIHVDDVDVLKGVYATPIENSKRCMPLYFFIKVLHWIVPYGVIHKDDTVYYNSLRSAIDGFKEYNFFTLSGQRIVLDRELTVDDLKDTDHVGFIDNDGDKGYFLRSTSTSIATVSLNGMVGFFDRGNMPGSLQIAISNERVKKLFKFSFRTDLYHWLSTNEDL